MAAPSPSLDSITRGWFLKVTGVSTWTAEKPNTFDAIKLVDKSFPARKVERTIGDDIRLPSISELKTVYTRIVLWLQDNIDLIEESNNLQNYYCGIRRLEMIATRLDCDDLRKTTREIRIQLFGEEKSLEEPPLVLEDLSQAPVNIGVPKELEEHIRWSSDHSDFKPGECVVIKRSDKSLRFGAIIDHPENITEKRRYLTAFQDGDQPPTIIDTGHIAILVEKVDPEDPNSLDQYKPFSCFSVKNIGRIPNSLADIVLSLNGGSARTNPAFIFKRQRTN